ncbi:MAG: hypothetical protein QXR62_03545 [Candidatus Bathyarchaeia archaeon]
MILSHDDADGISSAILAMRLHNQDKVTFSRLIYSIPEADYESPLILTDIGSNLRDAKKIADLLRRDFTIFHYDHHSRIDRTVFDKLEAEKKYNSLINEGAPSTSSILLESLLSSKHTTSDIFWGVVGEIGDLAHIRGNEDFYKHFSMLPHEYRTVELSDWGLSNLGSHLRIYDTAVGKVVRFLKDIRDAGSDVEWELVHKIIENREDIPAVLEIVDRYFERVSMNAYLLRKKVDDMLFDAGEVGKRLREGAKFKALLLPPLPSEPRILLVTFDIEPTYRSPIADIIASRIAIRRPELTIVSINMHPMKLDGKEIVLGSVRCPNPEKYPSAISIVKIVGSISSLGIYGGHIEAGGFSIEREKVPSLVKSLAGLPGHRVKEEIVEEV